LLSLPEAAAVGSNASSMLSEVMKKVVGPPFAAVATGVVAS
jgi:hypothetical protein